MTLADPLFATLPDPEREAQFYDGVVTKRLLAWGLDVTAIALLTLVVVPFTAFTALFYLPLLYVVVAFLYRWATLARVSATPGQWLCGIEFRRADGARLDAVAAGLHVTGYTISMMVFPAQLVSMALMTVSARGQTLYDAALGIVAIRRAAVD